jgi:hypothetical protein
MQGVPSASASATLSQGGSGTSFGFTGSFQSAPRAMVYSVVAMDFSISRARLLVSEVIRTLYSATTSPT